jgi:hypothetical protein
LGTIPYLKGKRQMNLERGSIIAIEITLTSSMHTKNFKGSRQVGLTRGKGEGGFKLREEAKL